MISPSDPQRCGNNGREGPGSITTAQIVFNKNRSKVGNSRLCPFIPSVPRGDRGGALSPCTGLDAGGSRVDHFKRPKAIPNTGGQWGLGLGGTHRRAILEEIWGEARNLPLREPPTSRKVHK